jgi:trk system potassium uptake protein TrkA
VEEASRTLHTDMPETIRRVVLFGADTLARKTAKVILQEDAELKIVEKDAALCRKAMDELGEKAMVIHSAYEDHKLFEDEGFKYADMIIAAGTNDEKNIVKCVEAREYGVKKTVAINNDPSYYGLMHTLGIVVVRGSKAGAHYAILEKIASSTVTTQRLFCGGEGVMFLRKIYAHSPLIGKPVRPYKDGKVKTLLVRDGGFVSADSKTVFKEGDVLALFATATYEEVVRQWIETL